MLDLFLSLNQSPAAYGQFLEPCVNGFFDSDRRRPYHAPAMANPLLDHALPEELAERGQAFEFKGEIRDFRRLVEIIEAGLESGSGPFKPREWRSAPVDIRLRFTWADARQEIPALEGEISTAIAAVCQRCLEPCELPLTTTLKMLLLNSADATRVEGEFEIWEVEGGAIRPLDIVEEALIMALPLSVKHRSRDECGPLAESVADEKIETVRPFKDLRAQMNKADD
jgi:hypothetical protein